MVDKNLIICSECKRDLDWVDTIDMEGSINEGYITESQIWECKSCNEEYYVKQTVHFCEWDTEVDIIKKIE